MKKSKRAGTDRLRNGANVSVPPPTEYGRMEQSRCFCVPFGVEIRRHELMNGIIYLVGLVVVVMLILSFLGLR